MTITLNSSFSEFEQIGVNLALMSNNDVCAITLNIDNSFDSIEDLCRRIENQMDIDFMFTTSKNGYEYAYAVYDNTGTNGVEFSYVSAVYEYDSVFYIIDLGCEKKNKTDEVIERYKDWFDGVTFEETE